MTSDTDRREEVLPRITSVETAIEHLVRSNEIIEARRAEDAARMEAQRAADYERMEARRAEDFKRIEDQRAQDFTRIETQRAEDNARMERTVERIETKLDHLTYAIIGGAVVIIGTLIALQAF